ncbi:MAG: serine hydrolase domain-containing protein [Egibacteraceae bacterium]
MRELHPGLIVHVRLPDGQRAHAWAGAASLELAAPVGPETVMNVGSVAKQITAYLALLSERQGILDLHTRAARILPRLRMTDVTIVELIRHGGGIRDAESMLSLAGLRELDHYTGDDLLELAYRQHERAVAPGRFLYSNTGYLLLAKILETVHATGLQQLADDLVFAPLGMPSTRFKTDPGQVVPHAASSYKLASHGNWEHQARPVALPGPGSLWSSASDLSRWLGHLQQCWAEQPPGTLLFDTAMGYVTSDRPPYRYGPGLYAGLRTPGGGMVFHHGHEHGFSAATHLTRAGLRIACLSNNGDVKADQMLARIVDHLAEGHASQELQMLLDEIVTASLIAKRCAVTEFAIPDKRPWPTRFVCDQVPGTLQLAYDGTTLCLWRRGTCDQLIPTGIDELTYAGPGYTLRLPAIPNPVGAGPREFTLNLDRAPGLQYRAILPDTESR